MLRILLATAALLMSLYKKLSYDLLKDFAPPAGGLHEARGGR
jgi:hypothetical protein